MIGCANCGTLNRAGSKFCSNCGRRLEPAPSIVCPACSRLTPPESTFCKFCGTALHAVAPAGGMEYARPSQAPPRTASAPQTTKASASPPTQLPPWLFESKDKAASPPPAAPRLPRVAPSDEISDNKYLQGIRGVLPRASAWLGPQKVDTEAKPSSR